MKAALLVGYGGVDQLELRDVPEPPTGPGQVKVGVVGASINPIDWKLRHGAKRPGTSLELPAILGRDAAGTVVELGLDLVDAAAVPLVAKSRGAKVWAGVRRAQKEAAAALGVEGVVALDDEEDSRRLPTLDGIADTLGAATTQRLLERLRQAGTVASVVGEPEAPTSGGLEVRHVWAHPDPDRLASMLRAVAEGALVIPIARRFRLAEIREAQELAEKGAGGKVLLRV